MPDEEKSYPLNISQSALLGLLAMVNGQGWAKSPKLQRRAFKLRRALPKIVRPRNMLEEMGKEWDEAKIPEFSILERERDTGKMCLEHFSKEGLLLNNEAVEELFDAFGVYE